MSIQLFPYKLSHRELEARLQPGLTVLPGQLLRFDEQGQVYGQITEVWATTEPNHNGEVVQMVRVQLLRGLPSMKSTSITLLQPSQMADELAGLLPKPEHSVVLSGFEGEYLRFGALTLLEGSDFVGKYHALLALMQAIRPYQKLLVIDPLGVFETVGDLTCYVAGEQVRLGLQQVNGKRFLDVFGAQFPAGVRKPVMEVVAAYWPEAGPFTGFSRLLTSGMITESLLKNLILQNCASVIHNKVFAETPEQVLNLATLAQNPISVLDVSVLQDPWKGYFYQEVLAEVFANPALGLVPILIYPENYLPDLLHWVQKADEYQVHLLGLVSPYAGPSIFQLANNVVSVKPMGPWTLQGDLTLGLPVLIGGESELVVTPSILPEPQALSAPVEKVPEIPPAQLVMSPAEVPPAFYPPLQELFLENNIPEPEAAAEDNLTAPAQELGIPDLVTEHSAETVSPPPEPVQFFNSWTQEPLDNADMVAPPYVGEVAPVEQSDEEESPLPPFPQTSSLFRTPIVDLSSPVAEAVPSFLSVEQLSALLNTPVDEENEASESEVSDSEAELALESPPSSMSSETQVEAVAPFELPDPLNYPDAEEGAIPDDMGDASNFPERWPEGVKDSSQFVPLGFRSVPSENLISKEAGLADVPVSSLGEQISVEPAMFAVQEAVPEPLPVFPEPEEFEREEFSFDLNLDQKAESLYESHPQAPTAQSVLPESVARSLSGFEQPETLPHNPLLDFDTEEVAQRLGQPEKLSSPQVEPELFELPMPEHGIPAVDEIAVATENVETAHAAQEADMQEALDLIFPRQFEMSPASEPEVQVPAERTPSSEVVIEEEPVPVIQKKLEPTPAGLPSFKTGDKVRHASYGLGIVQKVIPMDDSVVLNVTFENVGKRLLDPALTQLTLESAG